MKMSVRIALGLVIIASTALYSCEKEYEDRSCDTPSKVECTFDSSKVNVRVSNFTGYPLCDFKVIYRKDDQLVYDYGTLKEGEISCYTALDFTSKYPEVTFNLGTGKFTIPDSLLTNDKYSSQKETSSGFYTFLIQTAHSLDSQTVVTYFVVEGAN